MKTTNKLAIAVAAATTSVIATAQLDTATDAALGDTDAVAVAIIASCETHQSLQALQQTAGLIDAGCALGDKDASCAPSLASAEVRSLLSGGISSLNSITAESGGASVGATNSGGAAAGCTAADGPFVALRVGDNGLQGADEFVGASVSLSSNGADSAVISTAEGGVKKNGVIGFVAATSLVGASDQIGFIKLDGVSPSLANTMSCNYNMVSNVNAPGSTIPAVDNVMGLTVGVDTDPTCIHHFAGTPLKGQPYSAVSIIEEADGGNRGN